MTWHILVAPCGSGLAQQFQHGNTPSLTTGMQGTGAHCSASAAVPLREAAALCTAVPALRMEEPRASSSLPVTWESPTKRQPGSLLQRGHGAWQPARWPTNSQPAETGLAAAGCSALHPPARPGHVLLGESWGWAGVGGLCKTHRK